jgi:hypothetical protein
MAMQKKIISSLLFIHFIWSLNAQTFIFVSPKGNDKSNGTKDKPFATLIRAQEEVRKIKGAVVVYLRKGTYYLTKPVIFTPEDSRKNNSKVIYKNYDDEKVVISGGMPIPLKWEVYKGNIQMAKVSSDATFDQLFVNGQLQRMARYPNYNPSSHFLGGTAANAVSAEKAKTWANPEGGYVHALHKHEWGDFHYLIKGKDANEELILEGGWQNNRKMGMHDRYRFAENIFEELDTAQEWFYDKRNKLLYFYPEKNLKLNSALIEVPQIAHLIEFKGSEKAPVTNISIEGVEFTQTLRTFMENKEPLLRSDWTTYRGGAVLFEGAVNCNLKNCTLRSLGGNAVYFSNYNRNCEIQGCQIHEIGANAICFVGDPNAVRSASFEYNEFVPLDKMDRTPGPKTDNFPAQCTVFDNLMFNLGQVEKQSTGVQLSMCQNITISHNTIYDIPRAGINVNEGTWGGHIIEYNDVFNTVNESGDHGSFNSWGRDRYWHPNKKILDSIVEHDYDLTQLDVVETITIRNNRMRCDHGWDIDLDDGSSNYHIYNNLCLNGGIKLREGVNRIVENNIIINNSFHPHVWFKNSEDVFVRNIVAAGYFPIGVKSWGKEVDYNCFPDSVSLVASMKRGTDKHSVCGDPLFENPNEGNFRVKENSPAIKVGFKNFSMDSFGVVSPHLKAIAKPVPMPKVIALDHVTPDETIDFMGAKVKSLSTPGEQSATGMGEITGIFVVEVTGGSGASKFLQPNDVIISFNYKKLKKLRDLLEARMSVIGSNTEVVVFRNQKELKQWVELSDNK